MAAKGRKCDDMERATVLLDWIIKPLPDIRGVCVEGQKRGMDDYWHSAAIVEAVRPTVVVTVTGSVYKLEGKINKYCTIDNGFSKDVASAFSRGFPRNWNQVIQDFYRQLEDSISLAAEISPVKGKKQRQGHKMADSVRKDKAPAVCSHKLQAQDHIHGSIWTPAGLLKQKLSTSDVTVTRSGRVSLPPLARWTGQCYRKIPNSDDIEVTFETDCAKKTHHHTTAQLLKLPKSSLKMIYNMSLSKSVHLLPGPTTKIPDRRLNQTVSDHRLKQTINDRRLNQTINVLKNIDEASPLPTYEISRMESSEAFCAGSKIKTKKSPGKLGTDREIKAQKSPDKLRTRRDIKAQKKSLDKLVAAKKVKTKKSPDKLVTGREIKTKKSPDKLVAWRKVKTKKSPDKLIFGRKTSLKVNAFIGSADENTKRGISHPVKQSFQGMATTGTNVTLASNKGMRPHHVQLSPVETGPDGVLETSRRSARHSHGLLTRDSTDIHTGIILGKSLRVVLSRNLPNDGSSPPVNTKTQRSAKMPARFLDMKQDSGPVRKSDPGALKSCSNVDSDSPFLQSTDSSERRLSMSYRKPGRDFQANPQLQADISDSKSREPTDSSSADVKDRHFQTQKAAAKTKRKKPDNKKSHASWSSDKSDHKSDGKGLPKPRRGGLITDVGTTAVPKASQAKSHGLSTSSKSAGGGVVSLLSSTDLTEPPVAGKGKPVSADKKKPGTNRKRKRETDNEAVRIGAAGNNTVVERKPRKRRKMVDVTPSGDVPWNQQEKDLLHRALKDVNVADTSYWEKVAAIVGTRSQTECQGFYRQSLEGKDTGKPRKCLSASHRQKTTRKKGEPICGGKGTLKRKQEVRALLQEQNEGYEDNLFEATPFINRYQQPSLFTVNVEKTDSEIFGANHNCITPVASTSAISTPSTILRAKMVSVKKTPQSDIVSALDDTPVSFNRRKADQYIKSFIDRQRKAEPGPVAVQNDSSILNLSNLPVRSLFSPSTHPSADFDSHRTNTEDEGDEHGEDRSPYMYYWNDES